MEAPTWIGRTLGGRYRIDALLGQGGMSAVYKATDPNLKRVVAVKLIHSHLSSDPLFVERFEAEAAAVASLRHANIVQVYDFNNDSGLYYMVLEFIPGETLQERLKRVTTDKRQLSLQEALRFTINIADAAGYAHQHGMVHRDIKPANIMLDVQGQAILMDFGIVKIMGGDSHTSSGAVVGTALYISPELIRGEVPDPRSDIYSLGVTLYEMLSGRPPFVADSAMTLMMIHLNDPVPDLHSFRPDPPAQVMEIVRKCLAKDRGDRYQTAAELSADLRRALTSLEIEATSVQGKETAAETVAATLVSDRPLPPRPEAVSGKKTQIQPEAKTKKSSSKGFKIAGLVAGAGLLTIALCAVLGVNLFRNSFAKEQPTPTKSPVLSTVTALLPVTGNTQPASPEPASTSTAEMPGSAPTVVNVAEVQHVSYPASSIAAGTEVFDVSSKDTASEQRAPYGDSYDINLLERPFLQDMIYVPDLDIQSFNLKQDGDWYYVSMQLAGSDPNNSLGIDYAVDIDTDRDGFGDLLIWASPPYSTDWKTDTVQVYADMNHDSAGKNADKSDAPVTTDGYETLVFDGTQGIAEDTDLAWVRVAGENAIQFAFKRTLVGDKIMFGAMADAGLKDPSQLDYTDRFTAAVAGSPVGGKANYPLASLFAVDNTCRSAFGFAPTGYEKRICPRVIQPVVKDKGGGGNSPSGCQEPPGGCPADAPNWWPDPHCACSATPYNGG
jgi:serine/threonine protein kinase